MCGFCTAAGDSGPGCGPGLGTLRAEFTQPLNTPDIAQNIPGDETSDATIAVGETVNETLEVRNDDDWFAITLSENQTIQIDVAGTGGNALFDPIIRIYDQNGSLVRYFDDGEGPSSSHIWTALADGQYFISVRSYAALYSGDYALSVSAAASPPPSSLVDVVRGNTSLNQSAPIQVYFAETGDTYSFDGTTYSASGFNAYEEAQLMSIFTGLSEFTTLQFQKTTNRAAADLEWGTATLPSSSQGTLLGFFFFPSFGGNGGYGLLNNNFSGWSSAPGGGMDTGGFMYDVSIHELGHGLGLGHTHDTGNGSTVMPGVAGSGSLGAFDLNQTVYSVMSYNNGWLTKPGGAPAGNFYNHGYARTFGTIDIAALQAMYGTNTTHAGGNDVYSLATANGQGVGYSAIWDTGGTDEIRYDGAADANLDLRAATLRSEVGGGGYISYSDGVYDGFTISNGVEIENATSGSGNDRLTGNGLANTLNAGGGDDTIIAGEGDDWLIGGPGSDALDGQGGTDTVDYSAEAAGVNVALDGSFTNSGGAAGDTLTSIENVTGTAQDDNLFGDAEGNLLIGGNGNDVLVGNGGADTLRGGDGFDQLIGTDGGAGDVLDGGGGRNLASYSGAGEAQSVNLSDRQDSATNSGENTADTWISITGVIGATNFANTLIGDDGSNDFIGGLQADVFYGGGDIDAMVGLAGDDLFYGGAGNDVLIAGAGTDTLFGEAGADVFYVEPGDGENIIADWVEADDFFLFYQTSLTSWSELTFLEIDLGAGQVNTEITADLLPGVKVTVLGVGEDALDDAGNFFFV